MSDESDPDNDRTSIEILAPTEIGRVPVVGVGASAGGLEALKQLLEAMPTNTGMAFVLLSHLAPEHASAMAPILQRATRMPVVEATDGESVEPDHVYVIPPGQLLSIADGVLELAPRNANAHQVVDHFLESLADDLRDRAIGVVLSGTARDGTQGLESIKAVGGVTFAQDASAQYDGMPRSAIDSGCVDYVLPPDAIASEIAMLALRRDTPANADAIDPSLDDAAHLPEILELLLRTTGIDFTGYKSSTLLRRVRRRMILRQSDGIAQYVDSLRQQAAEVAALCDDILIGVTSFFRNPPAFSALAEQVFPTLLQGHSQHDPVRIWAVGCSTGQEAYSLAIELTEAAERAGSPFRIQLFATDLNERAVETARRGVYPKDITEHVSPERLQRFFVETADGYRISKSIRDACVFSRHNLLVDPPFSRIDLVSCRNLLIYLEPSLQRRVIPILHYALRPDGYLWLGGAEALGAYRALFDTLDSKHKIYTKRGGNGRHVARAARRSQQPSAAMLPIATHIPDARASLLREGDRLLLNRFAPPAVVISSDLEILQFRGDTGLYLTPAPGQASLSLLKMLREDLLVSVHAAIISAGRSQTTVRTDSLRVKTHAGSTRVAIEVVPISDGAGGFLVLFEGDAASPDANRTIEHERTEPLADRERADLIRELTATREYLQRVIEQQEAANEELQSASEEVQSANEELQSTNEELETSKEEIQSSNEELSIYNDELHSRNADLLRLNADLNNVLDSVHMPMVILGHDLEVRRFTPSASRLFALSGPLSEARLDARAVHFDMPDLSSRLLQVMDSGAPYEREVRDDAGTLVLAAIASVRHRGSDRRRNRDPRRRRSDQTRTGVSGEHRRNHARAAAGARRRSAHSHGQCGVPHRVPDHARSNRRTSAVRAGRW